VAVVAVAVAVAVAGEVVAVVAAAVVVAADCLETQEITRLATTRKLKRRLSARKIWSR